MAEDKNAVSSDIESSCFGVLITFFSFSLRLGGLIVLGYKGLL